MISPLTSELLELELRLEELDVSDEVVVSVELDADELVVERVELDSADVVVVVAVSELELAELVVVVVVKAQAVWRSWWGEAPLLVAVLDILHHVTPSQELSNPALVCIPTQQNMQAHSIAR